MTSSKPDKWLIEDSEEEEGFGDDTLKSPPAQVISSIAEYTLPIRNSSPVATEHSHVSLFTEDTVHRETSAATAIIETSIPVQVKAKRRPRPAYKGSSVADESIKQDTASSSTSSYALISDNAQFSIKSFSDPTFSAGIADRAKTGRRRHATADLSVPSSKYPSSIVKDAVFVLLSDDEHDKAGPSFSGRRTEPDVTAVPSGSRPSRVATVPHTGDISTLPPSDPPSSMIPITRPPSPIFDKPRADAESTPLSSSPVTIRKRAKRARIDDDDIYDGSIVIDHVVSKSADNEGGPNAKKRKKDRKPNEKTNLIVDSGDALSLLKNDVPLSKKRRRKAKDRMPDAEFKSKEFIQNSSDDDIAFLPTSSTSAPRVSYSDPASATISVLPSANTLIQSSHLHPSKPLEASGSLLSSLSTSVLPSEPLSVPPSAKCTAPPTSPCVVITHAPRSDKSKERVIAEMSSAVASAAAIDKVHADSPTPARNEPSSISVGPEETIGISAAKRDKKNKKGKQKAKEDDQVGLDDVQRPVQDTSRSKKDQPRSRKTRNKVAILSSDDDEPLEEQESAQLQEIITERIPTKAKEDHSENKENKSLLPRARQQPETFSISTAASDPTMQTPISKSRTSTPRLPLRKDSMSALIRRVSSKVNSPLASPAPGYIHSPLAKSSRATLSRIAPLHPNRRTPPPALPRPPPPKKSKKMLDLEEKWEMELADSVEGWACMTDEERAILKRAKKDMELGYED